MPIGSVVLQETLVPGEETLVPGETVSSETFNAGYNCLIQISGTFLQASRFLCALVEFAAAGASKIGGPDTFKLYFNLN